MKYCIGFLLIFTSILTSCNRNGNTGNNTSLVIEDFIIPADSFSLPFYSIWNVNEKNALFIGYNSHLNSLDFFELENRCFSQRVYFENSGPNQISQPLSIYYKSSDSIFIAEQLSVKLFSIKKGIIKKFEPYKAKGYNYQQIGELYSYTYFPLIFNEASNSVYLGCNQYNDKLSKPLMVEYNLDHDSLYFLSIYYPIDMIAKDLNYGYLKQVNVSGIDSGRIYYNFSFQPGYHYFDLNKQQLMDFPCMDKKVTRAYPITGAGDRESLTNYAIMNPHYFAPLITKKNIYQFSFDATPLSQSNGKLSTFKDKTWSLLIFQKNGTFIQRVLLDVKPVQLHSWFICRNNLYFAPHLSALEPARQKSNDLFFKRIRID